MLKAIGSKVVVKRDESESKTPGGIHLPDGAKEKPRKGKIVAVGEGRLLPDGKLVPLSVKVGDQVLFGAYGGTEVSEGGKNFLVIDESELLAVVVE